MDADSSRDVLARLSRAVGETRAAKPATADDLQSLGIQVEYVTEDGEPA